MKKISLFLIIMLLLPFACKKKREFKLPKGVEILTFKRNVHSKKRFIYQSNMEGTFSSGETQHKFWAGIHEDPNHRIDVRLLGNRDDIFFTAHFKETGTKVACKPHKNGTISGCTIKRRRLKEHEFTIEVLIPKGIKFKKRPEYRLFIGIEGKTPLSFYAKGK